MVTKYSILVIFIIALYAVQAHPMKPEVAECKAKFPIEDSALINLKMKGVLPDESNENGRCFVQCCMKVAENTVNDMDVFDVSLAKKNIGQYARLMFGPPGTPTPPKATIDAAVDKCASISEAGKCMTNYKIWSCLHKQLHV